MQETKRGNLTTRVFISCVKDEEVVLKPSCEGQRAGVVSHDSAAF